MAQWLARWALARGFRDRGAVVTTALSSHCVSAVGKLLILNCRDGNVRHTHDC